MLIIFALVILIGNGNIYAADIQEGRMDIRFTTFEEFPGDLIIIDSEGRKMGYDPIEDEEYDEIANACYEDEHGIADIVTGEVAHRYKWLYLSEVKDDERYHLQVIGTTKGRYILEFKFYDAEKNDLYEIFEKTISPGEIHTYTWEYKIPLGEEAKPEFCYEGKESDSESCSKKDDQ